MGSNDVPTLSGAFAPVHEEMICDDLAVEGEVPRDLSGLYVRNGPNRRFEAPGRYHGFDGDGMLHAVRFDRGRVQYRNRWVMTDGLADEIEAGGALWRGIKDPPRRDRRDRPVKNTSNTDVKFWNGDLVSMWYLGGAVYRCSPDDLSTVGPLALDARLAGLPISAHGKVDEQTGEFLFFAYGKEPPYMHYGVLGRSGELKTFIDVALPGPRLPHDMAVTTNFTILHDLPLFHDADALRAGHHKLAFHPELPARFGVVPRHGHGGIEIVMTGTPLRLPRDAHGAIDAPRVAQRVATLEHDFTFHEGRFNLRTGQTRERVLDGIVNSEFPPSIRAGWAARHAIPGTC